MSIKKIFKVITEDGQVFKFKNSTDALLKQKKLKEFKQKQTILKVEIIVNTRR